MFAVTFIGHQGWLFATDTTRVLFDALLVEPFGHKGMVGKVFPPRHVAVERFPAIDAAFFSHEHEDHFNVPSLNRLSRDIPIYLSARSSSAARTLLAEMGFRRVERFEPGQPVTVGDLELHFFAPDFLRENHSDEWDVMPVVVRDRNGDGSFFSNIDVNLPEPLVATIRELVGQPGVWCYTNNFTDFIATRMGKRNVRLRGALDAATSYLGNYRALFSGWSDPAAVLMCGGGWYFENELAWLNEQVFPLPSGHALAVLAAASPGVPFIAPHPGQTVTMVGGKMVRFGDVPFVRALPEREWPSRAWQPPVEKAPDFGPATGRKSFDEADLEELMRELADFATSLYGSLLFRALYSLSSQDLGGKRPTVVLALRVDDGDGEEAFMLEYAPQACRFVEAQAEDPSEAYLGGLECWASDLLAVLRGELGPTAMLFGRARQWCTLPDKFDLTLDGPLWMYANPLRRPDRFLALYREIVAAEPSDAPRIAAAEPAASADETAAAGAK